MYKPLRVISAVAALAAATGFCGVSSGCASRGAGAQAVSASQPATFQYCFSRGVETPVQGEAVTLERAWLPLFDDRFEKGLSTWSVKNYEGRLKIGLTEGDAAEAGHNVALITREGPNLDVAFELSSGPLPVVAGRVYRYTIIARHNLGLTSAFGFKDSYWTQVRWLGANGKVVGYTPMSLGPKTAAWREYSMEAAAPVDAVNAVLRIGFNDPHLRQGQFFRVARVTFTCRPQPPQYAAEGELVSRPLALNGLQAPPTLSWKARLPAGTVLRFQVRSAADVKGGPKDWTEFGGPDGLAASFYTVSGAPLAARRRGHGWFQYRAVLSTTEPAATPTLTEVTLGPIADRSWEAPDTTPPQLASHTPTRTSDAAGPLLFSLTDNPSGVGVDVNSLDVTLDGKPITADVKRQADGSFRYGPPAPLAVADGQPNLHHVTISARDFAGNALVRDWWLFVGPPVTEGVTSMRDDGVTLVDGKPFFPIGLYGVCKREHNDNNLDACFEELKAAGFNTVQTYQAGHDPERAEFFAAARRHGLKMFLSPASGRSRSGAAQALAEVARDATEPALLAWYLGDDTASHTSADDLIRRNLAVHDVDPFHLTTQADIVGSDLAGKSHYTDFVSATDGFLPELYPIRAADDQEVASIIRDMKEVAAEQTRAGHKTAVWAIVQAFEGWNNWYRMPTEAEVRAMTYLAIIHGATGITYYTYGGFGPTNHGVTHDPKFFAMMKALAAELASLSDAITERTPAQTQRVDIVSGPQTDALGYPTLSTLLKRHSGKSYLFVANSSREKAQATLAVEGAGPSIEVISEGRRIRSQAGAWQDEFGPYAVHIYVW